MWEIPLSDLRSDRVPQLVEEVDTGKLYEFWDGYVESIKAESRKRS